MKRPIQLCTNCGRETANWKEFDGRKFCDVACILQHVLEKADEYRERFLVPSPEKPASSVPGVIGEIIDSIRQTFQSNEVAQITESMRAYVDDPQSCPYCESSSIEYTESLPPTIGVKCNDCGESWVEVWELVGVDDVIVYETVPFVEDTESGIDHYE